MRTGNDKESAHCPNHRKMKKRLLLGIIAVACPSPKLWPTAESITCNRGPKPNLL